MQAQLQIDQEESLKKTAWDLGSTNLFTAGDEIAREGQQGVVTPIGFYQSDIDLFGIGPKLTAQRQRVALSEINMNLNQLEIRQEVQLAFARVYVQLRNVELFKELDSLYQNFERAAEVRFEVQEISRLALLAAKNQSKQMSLNLEQSEFDLADALIRFNLWMASDSVFTADQNDTYWRMPLPIESGSHNHPILRQANQNVEIAQADSRVAKAGLLPKFQAQYGPQRVDRQPNFMQYQFGLSIPLFFPTKRQNPGGQDTTGDCSS
nr:TolC family protein [Litoribacter populi]